MPSMRPRLLNCALGLAVLQLACTRAVPSLAPEPTQCPVATAKLAYTILDAARLERLSNPKAVALPQASPTFTVDSAVQNATLARKIVTESGLSFAYLNGGCHGRAHALTQLLADADISSFKIWVFSPAKYSLVRDELLAVEARLPSGETYPLTWGYHVAAAIHGPDGILVLDPAFSQSGLALEHWLASAGCNDCYVLTTDPKWYLFNTLNGYEIDGVEIPDRFPKIWTGGFWECTEPCADMFDELAMNDAAAYLIEELGKSSDGQAAAIRALVVNVDALKKMLTGTEELPQPALMSARKLYLERRGYWAQRFGPN